jgi:sulfotransferase
VVIRATQLKVLSYLRNMKKFHFLAGMPRSGSTLLCALLNQNPRFWAGPSTPVLTLICSLNKICNDDELFLAYPDQEARDACLFAIPHAYYSSKTEQVIFEKNRMYADYIPLLRRLLDPNVKVIVTYREIAEVLASFVSAIRRSGQNEGNVIDKSLIKAGLDVNDENRAVHISSTGGVAGLAAESIINALNEYPDSIYLVDYDDIVKDPERTIRDIYVFLEEPYFEHTFSNIRNEHIENDEKVYKIKDMHIVHPEVRRYSPLPESVLSRSIMEGCRVSPLYNKLRGLVRDVKIKREMRRNGALAHDFFIPEDPLRSVVSLDNTPLYSRRPALQTFASVMREYSTPIVD